MQICEYTKSLKSAINLLIEKVNSRTNFEDVDVEIEEIKDEN